MLSIHGALEFIRSGNPDALPAELKHEWMHEENLKLVGPYKGRQWSELTAHGSVVKSPPRFASSPSSSSSSSSSASSSNNPLVNPQHEQEGMTWRDLVVQVNSKLPPARRTATAAERLDARIAAMVG
jgi:hypothetical protein